MGWRIALEVFDHALMREIHTLERKPDDLWQQLHNRLQWEGEPVRSILNPERERRSAPGARPWMRTRARLRESTPLIRTLVGTGPMVGCAVSPDGRLVVSASVDRTVKLWDPDTGRELRTLTGHTGYVGRCAVSPDGAFVVSASDDTTLRLWNPATGEQLCVLRGHQEAVADCAVSPDGAYIASASLDGTLRLWDPATGEELRNLVHGEALHGCAISPDGAYVVSAGAGGTLKLWDPATGKQLRTLVDHSERSVLRDPHNLRGQGGKYDWVPVPAVVRGCAVSPDGAYVVSASADGTLKLWDPATGEELRMLADRDRPGDSLPALSGCAVSPDGTYVVTAIADGNLKLWDLATGKARRALRGERPVLTLTGHTAPVHGCAVSPDGAYVVSASSDGTVKLWDPAADKERFATGIPPPVEACAASPDGAYLVSAYSRWIIVSNSATGRKIRTLNVHTAVVLGCAVSPDRTYMASVSGDGSVKLLKHPFSRWREHLTVLRGVSHGLGGPVHGCAFSPDSAYVVAASDDGWVKLWDVRTGRELRTLTGHERAAQACAVSPDGAFIVSAGSDGTVKLWDPDTGRELHGQRHGVGAITSCAVSPDGAYVVSASEEGTLQIWDLAAVETVQAPRSRLRTLTGHRGAVRDCAVSPDGAYVVSAGDDQTLTLWHMETGRELATIPVYTSLLCLCLHPWLPFAACAYHDLRVKRIYATKNLNLIDFAGIEYGPIVVTALKRGTRATLRCPTCWRKHLLDERWLGQQIACPNPACNTRLRVNPRIAGTGSRLSGP